MYATDMNALALVPRQWLEFRDGSFCPLWKSVKLHLIHKRTKRQVRLFVCIVCLSVCPEASVLWVDEARCFI